MCVYIRVCMCNVCICSLCIYRLRERGQIINGVKYKISKPVYEYSMHLTCLFSILAWRIPMDRGSWQATVHRVAKSQTQLSD